MSYELDFSALWEFRALLFIGVLRTLELFALSLGIATAVGLLAALLRLSPLYVLKAPMVVYIEFFRGTPILIQLVWAFYVLPFVLGFDLPTFAIAVVALSLHVGAYLAELFRAGIQAIGRDQTEAARSLGLSKAQTFRRIVLPQAAVTMIPPYLNYAVVTLKLTALVSIIGGEEFLYAINQINQVSYRSIELYTAAALIYFILALPLLLGVTRLETTLRRRWGT